MESNYQHVVHTLHPYSLPIHGLHSYSEKFRFISPTIVIPSQLCLRGVVQVFVRAIWVKTRLVVDPTTRCTALMVAYVAVPGTCAQGAPTPLPRRAAEELLSPPAIW